jgi:signal transduction histidine kinase
MDDRSEPPATPHKADLIPSATPGMPDRGVTPRPRGTGQHETSQTYSRQQDSLTGWVYRTSAERTAAVAEERSHGSIRQRIFASVLLTLGGMAGVISFVYLMQGQAEEIQWLDHERSSRDQLWRMWIDSASDAAGPIGLSMELGDAAVALDAHWELRDANGVEIDSGGARPPGRLMGRVFKMPAVAGVGGESPSLAVTAVEPPLPDAFGGRVATLVWMLGITGAVLLAVIGWTFESMLVRPIDRLVRAARRLGRGQYDVPVGSAANSGELTLLADAFERMREELAGFHHDLEGKVDAATRKAEKALQELTRAQRLSEMGTLASGIAHEINNPLGGMLNAVVSLQKRHSEDERTTRYLELLVDGLRRIEDIVKRVLTFVPREAVRRPTELKGVLENAIGVVSHRLTNNGVLVHIDAPTTLPPVYGDQGALQSMFLNLFINAMHAMESSELKSLTVTAVPDQESSRVVVRIVDTGEGMPPDVLSRAFDLFYTTKEPGKGTGLGLSMVHEIVQQHQGTLEVDSAPGAGTTFTITLPAMKTMF